MDGNRATLRFDIQERFTLFPQHVEAKEILQLELTPEVEVRTEAEQVVVQGFLLLKGEYLGSTLQGASPPLEERVQFPDYVVEVSEGGPEAKTTEGLTGGLAEEKEEGEAQVFSIFHRIPVGIRVSAQRVASPESVQAQVEAFDFDLISPRELDIVAELTLFGVRVDDLSPAAEEAEAPTPSEAEAETLPPLKTASLSAREGFRAEGEERREPEEGREQERAQSAEEKAQGDPDGTTEQALSQPTPGEAAEAEAQAAEERTGDAVEEEETVVAASEGSAEEGQEGGVQEGEVQDEAQEEEAKVNITSKESPPEPISLSQFFRRLESSRAKAAEAAVSDPSDAEEEGGAEAASGDVPAAAQAKLEDGQEPETSAETAEGEGGESPWSRVMSEVEGEKRYRLRLYRVQKEDTLSRIAERYAVDVAELIKQNRLKPDEPLVEGIVLRVPD